jgi:nucleotide-binding universal stress UspA family protein
MCQRYPGSHRPVAVTARCAAAAWKWQDAWFRRDSRWSRTETNQLTAAPDTREAKRILVCYDGSAESDRALARAAEIALAGTCEVTVISVAEPLYPMRPYTGYADPGEEELHRRLLDDASRTLARDGIAAATLEPIAQTTDAIVEAARETRADLIVVGTRHRRLIERLLFGSVSGRLVAEAPCDVLVVR